VVIGVVAEELVSGLEDVLSVLEQTSSAGTSLTGRA
jgi:hypothetical protein